ncbi:hypothetical protein HRR83_001376 [Exophiala dermatitidis]|uniref:UBL3-like ubiquitin domain-containing protein n=2 Tax=Exophiala dermatitidis TaxID=5970 RepID=H6C6K2_EXODN|nr:uncharacterized protein HMPREF1120_07340 [Exophiala dermatitidis NIH/UT8656]KAJ4522877.1 hypothetical protein HRR75_001271 [Exophiala dermatitidis]EHY59348.1 hypothetical protein HMPREF1120_07340 [Exophiala dermatitidis NIH/UT8656]KAJ4526187.1 hypothetical protein HRR74_001380 [Exophiala dermatitidis]KAJ4526869.1 hypothetical protein HRR73_001666 [Exophiala dermatitidis]KAJ4532577.1 hypothetical protein HRR76_007568 [Exophiala dermatitidis]
MNPSGLTEQADQVSTDTRSIAQHTPQQQEQPPPHSQDLLPSPAVEMSSLPSDPAVSDSYVHPSSESFATSDARRSSLPPVAGPVRMDTSAAIDQSINPPPPPPSIPETQPVTRTFSTAIGPSSDSPVVAPKDSETTGPVLTVTLLLTSGARHPFRLDGKYLTKRNVDVANNDPFNLSVYKLKELILREWREEWEAKPSSPNYIRLISMGKLLDDKASLKDYKFGADSPNVLHMTIKPQDYVEEEDAKGGKANYTNPQESERRSPGCRCAIM